MDFEPIVETCAEALNNPKQRWPLKLQLLPADAAQVAAYPNLREALEGLVGFLERYPHHLEVDISGYLEAANEALEKSRKASD